MDVGSKYKQKRLLRRAAARKVVKHVGRNVFSSACPPWPVIRAKAAEYNVKV